MLFSSMTFLWIFLPLLLILYRLVPGRLRNAVLLLASLIFYAWGEPVYIVLILLSVSVNYLSGRWVESGRFKKPALFFCLAVNLGLLGYFKYFNFFAETVNGLMGRGVLGIRDIALPLGISFYTFQALSYVLDVYRGVTKAQKSFWNLLLYIMLFPQLVAGPIVKYKDVEKQLTGRVLSEGKAAYGVKRFLYGLSKKVLLSNTLAVYADMLMDRKAAELGAGAAWFGAALYSLQIYYDFSGYSDMAIGLGKMFGFDFMENFRYPYLADSVRDFWRRWHISLSAWFRDYVYIPLGGSRKGTAKTCRNLMLVFLLTGLWHGAGWNFILWGAYYGCFLVLERLFLGRLLEKNRWRALNHFYTMLVVMGGWVLFRQESLSDAGAWLYRMFLPFVGATPIEAASTGAIPGEVFPIWSSAAGASGAGVYGLAAVAGSKALLALAVGILLCGIVQRLLKKRGIAFWEKESVSLGEAAFLTVLLFLCVVQLVSGTYNPFIYFRF